MKKFLAFLTALFLAAPVLANTNPRPVIGISGVSANSDSVRAMIASINTAGGTPLFLSNYAQRDPAKDIEKIDALVLMGNAADIDPKRYGHAQHPETVNEMDTPEGQARAAYEYAIMEKALALKMPFLGICGGHQRLNVLRGGTLHQHVPDLVGHGDNAQHHYNVAPFVPVQPISLAPGTMLATIADTVDSLYVPGREADKTLMENSMHHQAADALGDGLRAAAYSDNFTKDGKTQRLIEAVEADPSGPLKDQFVLGVQWHPEFSASPLAPRLTARLVEEARKFAVKHQRTHPAGEAAKETRFSVLPVIQTPANADPDEDGVIGDILKGAVSQAGSPIP